MLSLIPKFAPWPLERPIPVEGITSIAVGESGIVVRSGNGISWAEVTPVTTEELHQVAFGNGVWMACGKNCTIIRSTDDGRTWEKLTMPAAIVSGTPLGEGSIVFDDGRFLVMGNNSSYFFTSDNGASWTRATYTAQIMTAFCSGKARKMSTGAIYQPGVGTSIRGFTIFTWNGGGYTVTNQNVTSASTFVVIGSITETKDYFVCVRQGAHAYRRTPVATAWASTRAGAGTAALVAGGSVTRKATDMVYQIGNAGSPSLIPIMYKGVAGTAWQQIPAETMQGMFGDLTKMKDIYEIDLGSLVIGDNKIWHSEDWESWNLSYTARALINSIHVHNNTQI